MSGPFVVDNSVVMSWCFEDEEQDYSDQVLTRLGEHGALVPGIWPLEVANVLQVALRQKRLSKAEVSRFASLLQGLPIVVSQEPPARVFGEILALSLETRLSAYDASYLDLAMREGLPLATLDRNLRRAARQCQVPLV